MPSTTRYRRGDIVLVPFPFTDLSSTKKRPALVVSPDKFNEHAQDVVLVAITSQPSDSHVVSLDEHDDVDGKLPLTSFVKVSKLFTTHPTLVLKKVCAIKPARLNVVLKELRRFFQEQPPRPLWRSPRHVWHETHTVTGCCRRQTANKSECNRRAVKPPPAAVSAWRVVPVVP